MPQLCAIAFSRCLKLPHRSLRLLQARAHLLQRRSRLLRLPRLLRPVVLNNVILEEVVDTQCSEPTAGQRLDQLHQTQWDILPAGKGGEIRVDVAWSVPILQSGLKVIYFRIPPAVCAVLK